MKNIPTGVDTIKSFRIDDSAGTFSFIELGGKLTFIDEEGAEVAKEEFVRKYLPRHEDGEMIPGPFSKFGIVEKLGKSGFFIEPVKGSTKTKKGAEKTRSAEIELLLKRESDEIQSVLYGMGIIKEQTGEK